MRLVQEPGSKSLAMQYLSASTGKVLKSTADLREQVRQQQQQQQQHVGVSGSAPSLSGSAPGPVTRATASQPLPQQHAAAAPPTIVSRVAHGGRFEPLPPQVAAAKAMAATWRSGGRGPKP